MSLASVREFLRLESAAGIILMMTAAIALVVDNSPLSVYYDLMLLTPMAVQVGDFAIAKPVLLWINDGLMAVFFLLVGLELKREFMEGDLRSPSQIALPGIAAVGGMAVPAAVYIALNAGDATALRGWAIPAATDIAFALGILAILGSRVPVSLKVFLTALAIFDDVGAIIIIAIFYTADLSLNALILGGIGVVALVALNLSGVTRLGPYFLVGLFLWVCVLKSGVHATLAGVVLALAIPLKGEDQAGHSPARHLEHLLHPWVAFLVLPAFAFANAGVDLRGAGIGAFFEPIALGIALGLFVGKQIGVAGFALVAIKLGLAKLPEGAGWKGFYGTCLLAGVGFTMSLFIGGLAFDDAARITQVKMGVLSGSILSAIAGFLLLRFSSRPDPVPARVSPGDR